MAPRARSTPVVSAGMGLALDPLPSVFVAEHPSGKAGRLDGIVGPDGRPIDVAPRFRGASLASLGLPHHLLGALDPQPKLRRSQVHPAPAPRRAALARVALDDH